MAWLENWKAILGSIAAALVVVLQIIQILIGSHIEGQLETKGAALELKSDKLGQLLDANGQISAGNRELLKQLHDELHKMEEELAKK